MDATTASKFSYTIYLDDKEVKKPSNVDQPMGVMKGQSVVAMSFKMGPNLFGKWKIIFPSTQPTKSTKATNTTSEPLSLAPVRSSLEPRGRTLRVCQSGAISGAPSGWLRSLRGAVMTAYLIGMGSFARS